MNKVFYSNGCKEFLNDEGERHRENDLPAMEYDNGELRWYINGKCHRENGPAIISANGTKYWYINNNLHREDGPAVEHIDGSSVYYLNGIYINENDFENEVIKLKLKRLVNL